MKPIWIPDAARRRVTHVPPRLRAPEVGTGMVTIRTTPTYSLSWSASDLAEILGFKAVP